MSWLARLLRDANLLSPAEGSPVVRSIEEIREAEIKQVTDQFIKDFPKRRPNRAERRRKQKGSNPIK